MTVAPARPGYSILIPADTLTRAGDYLVSLRSRSHEPGAELAARLQGRRLESLDVDDLLGELIDTKQGQIFAESAVAGDGSDWNLTELGLLGDVSVAVPCTIFDDGHHTRPQLHTPPFRGTLVYTPGALLRNGRGHTPADWHAVVGHDGQIDDAGYDALYRRRLLPVFEYVNAHASGPRSALLTIPGIGCGQFAGVFAGTLGIRLERALVRFLQEHGPSFPNLKAVYFDPYRECENSRHDIHGIALLVRPFTKHPHGGRSQLCRPAEFAEAGDDFADCDLFSNRGLGSCLLAGKRLLRGRPRHRRRRQGGGDELHGSADGRDGHLRHPIAAIHPAHALPHLERGARSRPCDPRPAALEARRGLARPLVTSGARRLPPTSLLDRGDAIAGARLP